HFFSHYKDLEPGKWAKIEHWDDAAEAKKLILQAIARASGEVMWRRRAPSACHRVQE
ncbi:MAG: inorganic diphosphatase, partial [Hyphomicrobium sp.]